MLNLLKWRCDLLVTGRDELKRVIYNIYVTGSGKRVNFAHTMIFQYKRCCSTTPFNVFGLAVSTILRLHSQFEELNVLLTGQACCLKTAT